MLFDSMMIIALKAHLRKLLMIIYYDASRRRLEFKRVVHYIGRRIELRSE
jgi:hypothetical protein